MTSTSAAGNVTSGSFDLDLYGDTEFSRHETSSSGDLYDEVLASTTKDDSAVKHTTVVKREAEAVGRVSASANSRRFQLYVGNLTWWTTDQDVLDAVEAVAGGSGGSGAEVKFYENRANGQSRGFCCVSVGSESAARAVLERLPARELHGRLPTAARATRQALTALEAASAAPRVPPPLPLRPPQNQPPPRMTGRQPPRLFPPRGPPPPIVRPALTAFNRPPPAIVRQPPPQIRHHHVPPPRLHHPQPPPPPGPAPHVNPAFFPSPSAAIATPSPMSGGEFEEIMSRNRTVASSAIARAVQDAANGEYASAVETLATAVSLIRQSKVSRDERCRVLVDSLRDTLRGVENRSYDGERGRRRGRRSRSRSPMSDRYEPHHLRGRSSESYERHHHHREYYYERPLSREREHHRSGRGDKHYHDERYPPRDHQSRRSDGGSSSRRPLPKIDEDRRRKSKEGSRRSRE